MESKDCYKTFIDETYNNNNITTRNDKCIDRAIEEFDLLHENAIKKIISISNCKDQYKGTA